MAQWSWRYAADWSIALVAGALLIGLIPRAAGAQGRRSDEERVLFLVPLPAEPGESAYAVELADQVRRRMATRFRYKLRVLETDEICKMLAESGFGCGTILQPEDGERLANAMQSDAFIASWLHLTDQTPTLRMRLVDLKRSGLSGWSTARGAAGDPPRRFAEAVVDTLNNQIRASEYARECIERRDRGEYRNALARAQRAFEMYRNHPSTAMCAAVAMEAEGQPVDSQIVMYERAVQGDSLSQRAWERLGRLRQAQGDSLGALEAFRVLARLNPDDRDRWRGILAGYIMVREYEQGEQLADEWLARNPDDLEFLQLKARACAEGAIWDCALDALTAQFDLDTSLARDTVFYAQVLGAAQELGDRSAVLRWSGEATKHLPDNVGYWRVLTGAVRNRAEALSAAAEAAAQDTSGAMNSPEWLADSAAAYNDSLMVLYSKLLGFDPEDQRTRYALAQLVIDGVAIDTAVPLDTARLSWGEALLDTITARSQDTALLMQSAVLYYQPAAELAQHRIEFPLALRLLEKALANDVMQRLTAPANFFIGFSLMFQVFEFDQRVLETESCELVDQEEEMIDRAIEALTVGRGISPATADQMLQQLRPMKPRISDLRKAFE
ncbi:MAG: tetratricopeptide repeat protein, partial [Gemmatimonadales bacterium]